MKPDAKKARPVTEKECALQERAAIMAEGCGKPQEWAERQIAREENAYSFAALIDQARRG